MNNQWIGITPSFQATDLSTEKILAVHMPQLRDPSADVFSFSIELGRLGRGIEDPQWLGIHAAAGTPLPASVIGSEITIHLQLYEGCLLYTSPSPRD